MKTLIFSDTHLTDKFNKGQYNLLKRIIEPADKIFINGDFWDAYTTDNSKFKKSDWQPLFKLLREKGAIHLFGNHDEEFYMEDCLGLFAKEHHQYLDVNIGKYNLHLEHGHLVYNTPEEMDFRNKNQFFLNVGFQFGLVEKLAQKIFTKHEYTQFVNNKMKKMRKDHERISDDQILVCGHTHRPEFNLEEKYINTGMIRYGYASYLSIENDKMNFVYDRF